MALAGYLEMTEQQWVDKVTELVHDLHALADKVAYIGSPSSMVSVRDLKPDYIKAASEIQKEISWSMANMGAWYLIGAASEATAAQRDAEVTS